MDLTSALRTFMSRRNQATSPPFFSESIRAYALEVGDAAR